MEFSTQVVLILVFGLLAIDNSASASKQITSNGFVNLEPHLLTNTSKSLHLNSVSTCGEIFSGNNSGGIFYKPFEQISKNERCVWIVGTPGAVGYTVDIQFLGVSTNQPGSGQELILTGARPTSSNVPALTSFLPPSTGIFTVEDSNLLIITFISSSTFFPSSSGFALTFEGIFAGNISKTSTASVHHILKAPLFEFKYPTGAKYASDELAAFVFLPERGYYSVSRTQVWYKGNMLEDRCRDVLSTFKFRSSLKEKWEVTELICEEQSLHSFHHDDISLMLFQSDYSKEYAGFWFYVAFGKPQCV